MSRRQTWSELRADRMMDPEVREACAEDRRLFLPGERDYTTLMAGHSHHPHNHDPSTDWAEMAAHITLEAEVLMPYLAETVSSIADLCRRDGLQVRRILDIGSGPGVGTCVLAQQFEEAVVVAVDGSSEMLEAAAARAAALGLSSRVQTERADIPEDLGRLGGANLAWVAMVLHHVEDLASTFRGLRSLLEPHGMLAIAEFGDPPRFLPDDLGIGSAGLSRRLGDVNPASAFPAVDFPSLIEAAGFEIVADRMVRVTLDPPLSNGAREVALRSLRRLRDLVEDVDAGDQAALDVLMDEDAPLGIARRPDVFLDVSRQIYVARVAPAASK